MVQQGFVVAMSLSAMLGVFLTFALFLCSTVNSPLATRYSRNPLQAFHVPLHAAMHTHTFMVMQRDKQYQGCLVHCARRPDVW